MLLATCCTPYRREPMTIIPHTWDGFRKMSTRLKTQRGHCVWFIVSIKAFVTLSFNQAVQQDDKFLEVKLKFVLCDGLNSKLAAPL